MLEKFRAAKQAEIRALKDRALSGSLPAVYPGQRPSFGAALRGFGQIAVIAEYKPASPSRGAIREGCPPQEMARVYANGGAQAISVLTEARYFRSSLSFLWEMDGFGLPLLRKDFLFDPLQVRQTAATPAAALLLIVRMFAAAPEVLAELLREAEQYGLEAVVEVFDGSDLELARQANAKIIQVNNRDLSTLKVDLNTSRGLIGRKQDTEVWICASGITRRDEVLEMGALGFEACLIGTSIMGSPDPSRMLRELTGSG